VTRTALLISCLLAGGIVGAQEQPDNTRVNRRDREQSEPTADQGKNSARDRELMRKIRRSIMDDESLSTYARNVKVIARSGHVTLKGPVHSQDEKQIIERKALEIAGAGNVTNSLSVKTRKSTRVKKEQPQ